MNSWKDKFPKDLQEKIAEVDEMISGRLNEITEQELYNQQRSVRPVTDTMTSVVTSLKKFLPSILRRKMRW